jgi:hypothetical protein
MRLLLPACASTELTVSTNGFSKLCVEGGKFRIGALGTGI